MLRMLVSVAGVSGQIRQTQHTSAAAGSISSFGMVRFVCKAIKPASKHSVVRAHPNTLFVTTTCHHTLQPSQPPDPTPPLAPATSWKKLGHAAAAATGATSSSASSPWQAAGLCTSLTVALGWYEWLHMSTPGTAMWRPAVASKKQRLCSTCGEFAGCRVQSEGLWVKPEAGLQEHSGQLAGTQWLCSTCSAVGRTLP